MPTLLLQNQLIMIREPVPVFAKSLFFPLKTKVLSGCQESKLNIEFMFKNISLILCTFKKDFD